MIDGKIYIGRYQYRKTKKFDRYWGSGTYIQRAILKHGINSFKKEILEEAIDNDFLNYLETFWIKELNATNSDTGYNLTFGGDCPTFTEEAKQNVSNAKKGKCISKLKGVPRSEEVRAKISVATKGKTKSQSEEAIISKLAYIRRRVALGLTKHSENTIEKIRQKKIERDNARTEPIVFSEEHRRKLSERLRGKSKPPRSAEHSKNQSKARKGIPWSEARRQAQVNRKNID